MNRALLKIRGLLERLDRSCFEYCPNLATHNILLDISHLTAKLLKKTRSLT